MPHKRSSYLGRITIKYSKLCLEGRNNRYEMKVTGEHKVEKNTVMNLKYRRARQLILVHQNIQSFQEKLQPFFPLRRMYI